MLILEANNVSNAMQENKQVKLLDSISFLIFCLVLMDCSISGGGKWFVVGPLSLRMILGLVSFACSIPAILRNFKTWVKNPIFIALALFIIYLIFSAVTGLTRGNRTDVLLSDIKGFAWLILVPVAMAVINSEKRLAIAMKCVIAGAAIQAIIIIGLSLFCAFNGDWASIIYDPVKNMQFGFVDLVTYDMVRVFFRSGPYMAAGCIFMFYLQIKSKKFNWLYAIGSALCLNAVLLSFTRSLYGAVFISVALIVVTLLIFALQRWKKTLAHIGVTLAVVTVLISAQHLITGANYIEFAVERTFSINILADKKYTPEQIEKAHQIEAYIDRTEASDDDVRGTTLTELKEMIGKSPVFGNGLGASINYRANGLVEYFYYDIVNKTGFAGLIIYYFPIGYMVFFIIRMWKRGEKDKILFGSACFIGLTTFLLATYFNPYMNASIGISCYSIALGCFTMLRCKKDQEHNAETA